MTALGFADISTLEFVRILWRMGFELDLLDGVHFVLNREDNTVVVRTDGVLTDAQQVFLLRQAGVRPTEYRRALRDASAASPEEYGTWVAPDARVEPETSGTYDLSRGLANAELVASAAETFEEVGDEPGASTMEGADRVSGDTVRRGRP